MLENERKWKKMKEKNKEEKKKRGCKGVPPETAQKNDFLHKSLVRKSWRNWGQKKSDFGHSTKKKKKKEKKTKKMKENARK